MDYYYSECLAGGAENALSLGQHFHSNTAACRLSFSKRNGPCPPQLVKLYVAKQASTAATYPLPWLGFDWNPIVNIVPRDVVVSDECQ